MACRAQFPWRRYGPSLAMVLVALVLRVLLLALTHAYLIPPGQDHFLFGAEMGRIARSIVMRGGFASPWHGQSGPTAIVGPVYPLLLTAVFKLFGIYTESSAWVMFGLNTLFSALTCLPIAALGSRVFGRTVGVLAGWTWAFFPYALYWPIRWIWDTSLTSLLLALLLLQIVAMQDSARIRDWVGLGLLWALAGLTNTTLLSLFPFLLVWLYSRLRVRGPRRLGLASVALVTFVLGMTPWVVRNHLAFGHFALRSNLGLELYQSNYPGASGLRETQRGPAFNAAEMEKYRRMGEWSYMAEKQHEAWQFISSHPKAFAVLILRRVVYFWTGTSEIVLPGHLLASFGFFTLVSVLAIVGLILAFSKCVPEAYVFAIVLAIFPLPYYVTHPESRFRHLIEPELALLAVFAAATAVASVTSRRHPVPPPRQIG